MRILPAINVAEGDEARLRQQFDAVPGARLFHVDVADGSMTANRSWSDPELLREVASARELQVHLMVREPEAVLGRWLAISPAEVIVHLDPLVEAEDGEATVVRLAKIRDACHAAGAKLVLAGTVAMEPRTLAAHRAYADALLVLAVTPGHSGEKMSAAALDFVAELRGDFDDIDIWVDGGVNLETVPLIRGAGANCAVAASAIFSSPDPAGALTALQSV
jgi:ribulose-phosphate 3-epimerase